MLEVEAYDTSRKNVAFGRLTTQSSTSSDKVADYAADGDMDTYTQTSGGMGEL